MVYDCRPPLLPVSLQLCDLGPVSVRPTLTSTSVAVHPWEDGPMIGDVVSDVVAFPELGVAPLVNSGRTSKTSYLRQMVLRLRMLFSRDRSLFRKCVLRLGIDLELVKALLDVSFLPMMVTPIMDPVVELVGSPTLYPEPPIPVLPIDEQVPVLEDVNEQVPSGGGWKSGSG